MKSNLQKIIEKASGHYTNRPPSRAWQLERID